MTFSARVVTVSDRAASWVYLDRSGPVVVAGLRELDCSVPDPVVVPDGTDVGDVIREAVAAGVDLVVTTGGTGISARDLTPQVTAKLVDYQVPGIPEVLRMSAWNAGVMTAGLSRGIAGVAGSTLIINLPGSPSACRDAVEVLREMVPHAIDQLNGVDHE